MQIPESVLWENDRKGSVKFTNPVWICGPIIGDNLFLKPTKDCSSPEYNSATTWLSSPRSSYYNLMWVKRWVMEDSYGATYNSLTFYCPVKINAVEVSSRVGSKILYTLKGLTRIQHRHFSKGHRWCMYMYTTYEECVSKCEDLNKSFNWDKNIINLQLSNHLTIRNTTHT